MATESQIANNLQINLLSSVCFIIVDDDSLYYCLLQLLNHKKTQKIIMLDTLLIKKDSFERFLLMNLKRGNSTLTLGHHVLIFVTYLISMSTTSLETFEADFFKFLIFASVSSSSLFTLSPELPVV